MNSKDLENIFQIQIIPTQAVKTEERLWDNVRFNMIAFSLLLGFNLTTNSLINAQLPAEILHFHRLIFFFDLATEVKSLFIFSISFFQEFVKNLNFCFF